MHCFSGTLRNMIENNETRTQLRLPAGLYARIIDAAATSGRSMNAEIVARLEGSFPASFKEQILKLRQAEVSGLRDFVHRISALRDEIKSRLDSGLVPTDRRNSMEASVKTASVEIAQAREELAIAEVRLAQARQELADWAGSGEAPAAHKKPRAKRG